jgi:hypothetical protein
MADLNRQKAIRVVGFYIVLILVLIRFLVYPLNVAVADKKISFAEQYESYKLKYQLLERQKGERQDSKAVVDKTALFPQLYEKGVGYSHIQADILEEFTKFVEAKGMTVLNFEMPEPVIGKDVSEVPVIIRIQAKPTGIIEIIEMIETNRRALRIKSTEISRSGQDFQFSLTISAFRVEK